MTATPPRVRLPYELRQRIEMLTIEDESDQRMVDRYLAPGAVVFQSNVDFLESLAHPARLGRKFNLNRHSKTNEETNSV